MDNERISVVPRTRLIVLLNHAYIHIRSNVMEDSI
jgi:hypothetical protein